MTLPNNTGSGSLAGRSANSVAKPIPARVYRTKPIQTGLMSDRPDVRLIATHTLGNSTIAAPSNMLREVLKPRKIPVINAAHPNNTADSTIALKRCILVVAKGAVVTCLAKVNPAPFHAGRSVVERPKPFNTWDLLDSLEQTIQFVEAGILNLEPAPPTLLVLNANFGSQAGTEILLETTHIRIDGGRSF